MKEYTYVTLRQKPELKEEAAYIRYVCLTK